MTLRLGIVGMSEGNGHPYSWAAIFNGYDCEAMLNCGFPDIPRYLGQRAWPADQVPLARVTHIWTQDQLLSRKVARASRIEHVVPSLEALIGKVDGVLLARDDAENHLSMASPFLKAGLPIYIDKPICTRLRDLHALYALQRYPGQIFSCSALRYANELALNDNVRSTIGPLRFIYAITPKDWERYAVHVIEPLLLMAGDCGYIVTHKQWSRGGVSSCHFAWENGFQAVVAAMGAISCPLSLRVLGESAWADLHFSDAFSAFKSALNDFVCGIIANDERTDPQLMRRVVEMVELGRTP